MFTTQNTQLLPDTSDNHTKEKESDKQHTLFIVRSGSSARVAQLGRCILWSKCRPESSWHGRVNKSRLCIEVMQTRIQIWQQPFPPSPSSQWKGSVSMVLWMRQQPSPSSTSHGAGLVSTTRWMRQQLSPPSSTSQSDGSLSTVLYFKGWDSNLLHSLLRLRALA